MYELKRIIVSLDLTELDEEVVRYTSVMAEIMDADTIYFLHVAASLDLPDTLSEEYGAALAPVDETIKHETQTTVDKYFAGRDTTDIYVDVLEGKPTETVLKYAKRKEADLIVLGKPNQSVRPRLHLGKIAELSSCSVLFVPKGADIRLDEVGVALDFSNQSYRALQQALRIADEGNQRQPPVRVYGLHVYRVPNGFSKTGKSYEEFAQIMEENAQKEATKFFKEHKLTSDTCEMHYQLSRDRAVHDELQAFAEDKNLDMLLVGSQGRTAAASLLLGSVSEEMLHYENHIPLFVVKEKDGNLGFFEALFKL
jgi:nucleotide-binding universal stress UspA family protein